MSILTSQAPRLVSSGATAGRSAVRKLGVAVRAHTTVYPGWRGCTPEQEIDAGEHHVSTRWLPPSWFPWRPREQASHGCGISSDSREGRQEGERGKSAETRRRGKISHLTAAPAKHANITAAATRDSWRSRVANLAAKAGLGMRGGGISLPVATLDAPTPRSPAGCIARVAGRRHARLAAGAGGLAARVAGVAGGLHTVNTSFRADPVGCCLPVPQGTIDVLFPCAHRQSRSRRSAPFTPPALLPASPRAVCAESIAGIREGLAIAAVKL